VYRPFAQYSPSDSKLDGRNTSHKVSLEYGALDHYIQLSRTICFDAAIQVARISHCHRKRFNTCRTSVTSIQHVGTAATALIASIARLNDSLEQIYPLQHLRALTDYLREMAYTYRPAKHMLDVLGPVINGFGWNIDNQMDLVTQKSSQNPSSAPPTLSTEPRRTPTESLYTRTESDDADIAMPEATSNTLKPMDVSFNAAGRPESMSQMKSTLPVSNHHGQDFGPYDAVMMLSPQSDLMQHFTGPQADRPFLMDHTPLVGPLPMPSAMESAFGKTNSVYCGAVSAFSHRLSSLSTEDPAEQLSWDDIFRQMGESAG
jgi:hypothetical protein